MHATTSTLQVDIGGNAAAANVFDDSDDEQQPAPAKPQAQEAPKSKSSKLAELANKKRKEMVRLYFAWRKASATQSRDMTSKVP